MNKRCSVCNHESRLQIEHGLRTAVPYRALAAQFNLSTSALCRHAKHLARALEAQRRQERASQQAGLLDKLSLLDSRLDRLFNSAADYHSLHVALGCIRESLRLLSLQERFRHDPANQS